ncbi:MAG: Holliday junction resolvase RuvX [Planctomycetaceae bacterium]
MSTDDASSENTPVPQVPGASDIPKYGVVLGIDYGTKRIGVSVSDREQKFSSPLHNHTRQGLQGDERFFRKVVAEYRPVGLVVGLPLHMNGNESQKSREATKFAVWLSQITQLPYTFQDERLTSFQAEKLLLAAEMTNKQRKERMDKLAAQILLQMWLDARQPPRVPKSLPPEDISEADARGEGPQEDGN